MKTKVILTAIFLAGFLLPGGAQTLTKTGVVKIKLRNTGSIIQDTQVKGYYYFYDLEKKDRKNVHYLLSLYDENLRPIHEVDIVRPKTYILVEGVYNGSAFGFLFYDTRSNEIELIAYDRTLKQAGTVKKKIANKNALAIYGIVAQGNDASQALLVGVPDKGFVHYGFTEDKKSHFDLSFYDNTMKKVWSSSAQQDAMKYEMAMEAFQDELYMGSLIMKKKNTTTKDIEFDLTVQQVTDGKTLFRVPMVTAKYSIMLADVYYNKAEQNFVVFGECYDIGDKELKSQSLGFITVVLDMNGKIVTEKVSTWETEISRVAPVNEKGKFDGSNTNILFHDIIRTADGQIFAVGEQYKKVVSAAGVASQVLAGLGAAGGMNAYSNISTMQLNVYNMVIFEFNPDYSLKKVHVFEKDKNQVLLPAGSGYTSSKMLSYYAKAIGGFDFTFSQLARDKNTFVVTYINYDREKGQKSKNVLSSVVYTPEKTFSVDRLDLNRKSSDYYVHQGKEGYVLVTEYYKKDKKLESRLEKINY